MDWPNDADDDVFRRLQENGFDFGNEYTIDFNIDFDRWSPKAETIKALCFHSASFSSRMRRSSQMEQPPVTLNFR